VVANAKVVDYETSKRLTGDLLLAYIPHPGTAVYAGYTNRRENQAWIAADPATVIPTVNPSLPTGAQVFVKVSNLLAPHPPPKGSSAR
jgi:hypothetical protein